jgi:hypothetical protein
MLPLTNERLTIASDVAVTSYPGLPSASALDYTYKISQLRLSENT